MGSEDRLQIREDAYVTFNKDLGNYIITNKRVFHEAIIFSTPSFLTLQKELYGMFGEAASKILELTGESAGSEAGKRIVHVTNLEEDIKKIYNGVSKWGFGRYELVELDLSKIHLQFNLHNNPLGIIEGEDLADRSKIIGHHFLVGFYKGYFHRVLGKEVTCKETLCINKGDRFCQFEIRGLA